MSSFSAAPTPLPTVAPVQTVQDRVKNIIAENSPLMQQARSDSLGQMNDRGLINSTMAISAGNRAVYDAATPIAQADAAAINEFTKMDKQQGFDITKMDIEQQNYLGRLGFQQANDLAKMATAQGYELQNMSVRQMNELQKMSVGQSYTVANAATAVTAAQNAATALAAVNTATATAAATTATNAATALNAAVAARDTAAALADSATATALERSNAAAALLTAQAKVTEASAEVTAATNAATALSNAATARDTALVTANTATATASAAAATALSNLNNTHEVTLEKSTLAVKSLLAYGDAVTAINASDSTKKAADVATALAQYKDRLNMIKAIDDVTGIVTFASSDDTADDDTTEASTAAETTADGLIGSGSTDNTDALGDADKWPHTGEQDID